MASTWFISEVLVAHRHNSLLMYLLPLPSFVLQQEAWEVTTDTGQHTKLTFC